MVDHTIYARACPPSTIQAHDPTLFSEQVLQASFFEQVLYASCSDTLLQINMRPRKGVPQKEVPPKIAVLQVPCENQVSLSARLL